MSTTAAIARDASVGRLTGARGPGFGHRSPCSHEREPGVTRIPSSCWNVSSVPRVLPDAISASRACFEGKTSRFSTPAVPLVEAEVRDEDDRILPRRGDHAREQHDVLVIMGW